MLAITYSQTSNWNALMVYKLLTVTKNYANETGPEHRSNEVNAISKKKNSVTMLAKICLKIAPLNMLTR